MDNRKLLVFLIILFVLPFLGSCTKQQIDTKLNVNKGIIDIGQFNLENQVVQLAGEWEFYSNQLLAPGEFTTAQKTGYVYIPGSWNQYIKKEGATSGNGYATYRLTLISSKNEKLALKIPRIFTAYKLWINGDLIVSVGTVGRTRDTAIPQYLPQISFFETHQGKNEVVVQVSNFHHRSGGILEGLKLGIEEQILGLRYKSLANELFLFGALLFIGTYHLALFLYRKKNRSALYFGVFCVLVSIRTLLVGERFLIFLFPDFSWEIAHKIQTLTFYLGVPLILMFFLTVFPKYFHRRIIKIAQFMGVSFGILVLLTPARIFTIFNPVYQIWVIIVIIYVLGMFMKIFSRREKGSWLITVGAVALVFSSLNDIVFLNIWMNDKGHPLLKTWFTMGNLSSLGQFIFAFTNSLLLAKRFSKSLEQEEVMTLRLTEINKNLDELVLQRTKALAESNEKIEQQKVELENANQELRQLSLKDPLTRLWNRRKYDQTIDLEWNRCIRYKRPMALLLLDIDYFKQYNDTYGHMAGDACLSKIGEALKNSLSRSTDMVARYGGEEFIILLSETDKEEAIEIAQKVRRKIEALNIPHQASLVNNYVTVSIGVTSRIPNTNSSHEDLFKVVDKALYQAKAAGRNQLKFLV